MRKYKQIKLTEECERLLLTMRSRFYYITEDGKIKDKQANKFVPKRIFLILLDKNILKVCDDGQIVLSHFGRCVYYETLVRSEYFLPVYVAELYFAQANARARRKKLAEDRAAKREKEKQALQIGSGTP